jgi:hypothetical protein
MDSLPPLPDPGFQSADDRRTIGRRFIVQARNYLEKGDRLQAGEKAWGAIAHNLKAIGELRGWRHDSHRLVENVGRQIVAESLDTDLGVFISEVYHKGHENFYENQRSEQTLREVIDEAEQALPVLEALQSAAPRPFTITSNTQLRRLMALTGNNNLGIGDTSPVGFSLKHTLEKHTPEVGGDAGNGDTTTEM